MLALLLPVAVCFGRFLVFPRRLSSHRARCLVGEQPSPQGRSLQPRGTGHRLYTGSCRRHHSLAVTPPQQSAPEGSGLSPGLGALDQVCVWTGGGRDVRRARWLWPGSWPWGQLFPLGSAAPTPGGTAKQLEKNTVVHPGMTRHKRDKPLGTMEAGVRLNIQCQ